MPEITLSTLSLILGAGALGGGVWGLTQEATVRELQPGGDVADGEDSRKIRA